MVWLGRSSLCRHIDPLIWISLLRNWIGGAWLPFWFFLGSSPRLNLFVHFLSFFRFCYSSEPPREIKQQPPSKKNRKRQENRENKTSTKVPGIYHRLKRVEKVWKDSRAETQKNLQITIWRLKKILENYLKN